MAKKRMIKLRKIAWKGEKVGKKLCKQKKKEYVHVQHMDCTRKKDMSQILPKINIPTPLL